MLTFSEPTLQGVSRQQYPAVYCGIDDLLKSKDFPTGTLLSLVPGSSAYLEVKLTFRGLSLRKHLENETYYGVQSAARELLRAMLQWSQPMLKMEG
jgi:hypothetical protein